MDTKPDLNRLSNEVEDYIEFRRSDGLQCIVFPIAEIGTLKIGPFKDEET